MQTIQLGWQPAAGLSLVLAGAAVAGARFAPRLGRTLRPYLRESSIVAGLYALWQYAGSLSTASGTGAFERGRWILRFEHGWLPSEKDAQQLIIHSELLTRGANWFYAAMHFSMLGAMLLWLFARHRSHYPRVRNVLVALTASCLIIQFVPVAPPRLLAGAGFVDTAARYGESVYQLSGITVDQLSAMPSVHVGWSLLVAWAVLTASPSRHRWWIGLHPLITTLVVVATANHYWLDGIVAAGLLLASIAVVTAAERVSGRLVAALRMNDGNPGRRRFAHLYKGSWRGVEADDAGDELIRSQG